jgi:hypothetical protein
MREVIGFLAWAALAAGTLVWTMVAFFAALMSFGFGGWRVLTIPIMWVFLLSPPTLWVICWVAGRRLLRSTVPQKSDNPE